MASSRIFLDLGWQGRTDKLDEPSDHRRNHIFWSKQRASNHTHTGTPVASGDHIIGPYDALYRLGPLLLLGFHKPSSLQRFILTSMTMTTNDPLREVVLRLGRKETRLPLLGDRLRRYSRRQDFGYSITESKVQEDDSPMKH